MSRRPGAGVSSPNGDGEALSITVKQDGAGCGCARKSLCEPPG
jgi:hypothetical protein